MNDKRDVTNKRPEVVEVLRQEPAQEMIAKTVVVIGSACIALGGVLGFALGFLEGREARRRENGRHEV